MNAELKIIVVRHPLAIHADRSVLSVLFAGQTLRDVLDQYAADQECVIVRINGVKLPAVEKDQYNQPLRPGDEVLILPAVRDPVSAIIAVTAWVATAAGYASIGAMLWSVGISIGISIGVAYLIRAIGGSPDDAEIDSTPSYGWSPVTIQRQGTPVPRAYGTNKEHGNIIAVADAGRSR
jgi:sulfur carrier protein ThiS